MVDVTGVASSTASQAVNGVVIVLIYLFGALIVGGVVWLYFWMKSYSKLRVWIVEETSNGYRLLSEDKAKKLKKEGIEYWKLLKNDVVMLTPPGKAVYPDEKGRLKAVAYLKNGFIVWPDTFDPRFDDNELKSLNLHPLTIEDRAAVVQNTINMQKLRRKSWGEILERFIFPIAFVLLVAIIMIFIVKPMEKMNEGLATMNQITENQGKLVAKLDDIYSNRQSLDGTEEGVVRPNQPPN